jgi:hypothetical protein
MHVWQGASGAGKCFLHDVACNFAVASNNDSTTPPGRIATSATTFRHYCAALSYLPLRQTFPPFPVIQRQDCRWEQLIG